MAVWVEDSTVNARNEPLDCTNYAQAAFYGFQIDLDAIEKRLKGENQITREGRKTAAPRVRQISGGI